MAGEKVISLQGYRDRASIPKDSPVRGTTILEYVELRIQRFNHPPDLAENIRRAVKDALENEVVPFDYTVSLNISSEEEQAAAIKAVRELGEYAIQRVQALNRRILVMLIEQCELEYQCGAHNG